MGLIGAAFGLGFIIGPSIGGFLMSQFGFSSIGYFCSALCLLNLILAYFILPESIKEKNLDSPIRILPFHEYKAIFNQPIHSRLFLINFIYISAFFFFQITSPLLWKERYGFNETEIGLILSFVGISTALVQGLLVGLLNKFFNEQTMLRTGTVILSLAIVSVPFIPADFFWLLIFPIIFLIALSGGFIGPSNLALISKTTAAQEQGKTLGLFQSFGSLARVFGPLVGSTLYGVTYYFPYVAGLTILILNLFLFILPLNRLLNKNKSDVAG